MCHASRDSSRTIWLAVTNLRLSEVFTASNKIDGEMRWLMVTIIIRMTSVAALLSVVALGAFMGNYQLPQGVVVCADVVLAVVAATL
jgi:hypothetical protein